MTDGATEVREPTPAEHLGEPAAPPHETRTDRVAYLNASLWLLAFGAVATAVLLVRAGQSPRLVFAIPFVVCGTAVGLCVRMGVTDLAYRLTVYGMWVSTLIGLSVLNGVEGPTVSVLAVVLVSAGWLVGSRAAIVLTVLTPVALVMMAVAADLHWRFPVSFPSPRGYTTLVQCTVAIAAGLLGYFSAKSFRSQLMELEDSHDQLTVSVGELTARGNELRAIQQDLARLNTHLEQIVEERTRHLQAAIQHLETFSYSVSHDLRAPLRAISGYLDALVEAEGGLHQEGSGHAEAIRRNITRMGELIEGLLELARIHRTELQKTRIDMHALLTEVLEQLMRRNEGARLQVDELPPAVGDRALVRQVLANLVGNALKYSARREVPQIHVGWSEPHRAWFVRDNGIGFDMSQAERLFATFQRLQDARDFEGVGVGLAVVKDIVERHGGKVWACGEPDRGATFYFTLPAAA